MNDFLSEGYSLEAGGTKSLVEKDDLALDLIENRILVNVDLVTKFVIR